MHTRSSGIGDPQSAGHTHRSGNAPADFRANDPPDNGRSSLKDVVHALATIAVLPAWLLYRFATLLAARRQTAWFQTISQSFALVPGIPGVILRRAFYCLVLPSCPRNVTIGFGTIMSAPDASIGRGVYIGAYCTLGRVTIGDDVLIGSNVDIMSGTRQHTFDRLDIPIRKQGGVFEMIHIGRDAWIGNSAVVAADVAEQSIVAAGAVVVKPVPPRVIVGGNPARILNSREQSTRSREGSPGCVPPDGDT